MGLQLEENREENRKKTVTGDENRGQTGRSQIFSKTVKPDPSNIQAAGVRGRWPRF
jgi:hypothetical protein